MADEKSGSRFDPTDLVEKAFLLGLGALELTREKAGDFAEELIEKGRMSQSEAKRVVDKMAEVADEQQKMIRRTISDEVANAVHATGGVTKKDFDDLKAELDRVETLLKEQEAEMGGAESMASEETDSTP